MLGVELPTLLVGNQRARGIPTRTTSLSQHEPRIRVAAILIDSDLQLLLRGSEVPTPIGLDPRHVMRSLPVVGRYLKVSLRHKVCQPLMRN